MGERNIISSNKAPKAIGPYSQGVVSGGLIFLSGQIPLDESGKLCNGTIEEQVELIFQTEYLENLLEIFEKNNVEIISLDYTGQKSKVLFKSANNNPNLMNDLIKNLNNIRDDLFYFQNDEVNLKSSLIIFFLSKKLELL